MAVVLVVDDDPAIRRVVESILQTVGHSVLVAGSGSEALEMCSRARPQIDAVVADVVMPGMTGTQMVQQMRTNGISIPVLYISDISGYADAQVCGAPLLLKPFKLESLVKCLQEVMIPERRPAASEGTVAISELRSRKG